MPFEFMKYALMNNYGTIKLYLFKDAERVTRALGARRKSDEEQQKYLVLQHSAINDPNRALMLIKITNRQIPYNTYNTSTILIKAKVTILER